RRPPRRLRPRRRPRRRRPRRRRRTRTRPRRPSDLPPLTGTARQAVIPDLGMAACRHVWGRVRVLPVLVLVLVPVLVRSAALSAGLSSSSPGAVRELSSPARDLEAQWALMSCRGLDNSCPGSGMAWGGARSGGGAERGRGRLSASGTGTARLPLREAGPWTGERVAQR